MIGRVYPRMMGKVYPRMMGRMYPRMTAALSSQTATDHIGGSPWGDSRKEGSKQMGPKLIEYLEWSNFLKRYLDDWKREFGS